MFGLSSFLVGVIVALIFEFVQLKSLASGTGRPIDECFFNSQGRFQRSGLIATKAHLVLSLKYFNFLKNS